MFEPSPYQTAVFDFVTSGRGDGLVNAVAGSGKTTTLVQAAQLIHGNALMCAFNKHIADELQRRLAGTTMTAKTIHGLGNSALYKALGRTRVEGTKYRHLCQEWIEREFSRTFRFESKQEARDYARALEKVVNFARLTLTPTERPALQLMADKYAIDVPDRALLSGVAIILDRGITLAQYGAKCIDFTDMLWLPLVLDLPVAQFDWVFVDEAQDLNAAQLALVLKARAPGGRMVFVGDSRQAIMAFAGADAESYAKIKSTTNATELPLSICYRCPTSHIALAQEIVPAIESAPHAAPGTVETILEDTLSSRVQEGDLVICRTTAPLIAWCIRLIAQRVPARVRGRDVAKELGELAEKIAAAGPWEEFLRYLSLYEAQQLKYLAQKDASEDQVQNLQDKCQALEVCYTSFSAPSVEALRREIEGLFADERASVWLSTVHRAKGLEADRVFILHPEKLPLRWKGQTEAQLTQEFNLRYVALTRAKQALFFLVEELPAAHEQQELV